MLDSTSLVCLLPPISRSQYPVLKVPRAAALSCSFAVRGVAARGINIRTSRPSRKGGRASPRSLHIRGARGRRRGREGPGAARGRGRATSVGGRRSVPELPGRKGGVIGGREGVGPAQTVAKRASDRAARRTRSDYCPSTPTAALRSGQILQAPLWIGEFIRLVNPAVHLGI